MRKVILAAAAAFVAASLATGAVLAEAQPALPPLEVPPEVPPPAAGWMQHMPRWMHQGMRDGAGPGGPAGGPRVFALVYRQQDRQLSPADVQKIAEAFLLWNGNHTWKVANVAAMSDGLIGFSLTTQEGSVVARFTMDPHTARIIRIG